MRYRLGTFLVYLCIGVKLLILDTLSTYTYEIDLKKFHLNTPFLLVPNCILRGGVNNFMPFRTTTSFNILHIWGYVLKVQQLSHICVGINLSPSSAVGMSLKVDQNMYDKVLIYPTMFGTKMDRFEHLRTRGTPPGGRPVGRRTAPPPGNPSEGC